MSQYKSSTSYSEENKITAEESNDFWESLLAETDVEQNNASRFDAALLHAEPECSVDEQVETLAAMVQRNPSHREIYIRLLGYCAERRLLFETEEEVSGYPEFVHAAQSPYRLIRNVVEAGGLCWLELDEAGAVIDSAHKEGLSFDEIDDLIDQFALEVTEAGRIVAERLSPERRLGDLVDRFPRRVDAYLDVLGFCDEPRSFAEVEIFLKNNDVMKFATHPGDGKPLHPSVFVDTLERAGGLVWDNGWKTTRRGRGLLEKLRAINV